MAMRALPKPNDQPVHTSGSYPTFSKTLDALNFSEAGGEMKAWNQVRRIICR